MNDKNLEWTVKEEHKLLKTPVFTINETTSISPRGEEGHYITTEAPDWVIVIPEMEDCFLMVKQWRHAGNCLSIEFPGGVINKGENPKDAALREMEEETGYKAKDLISLGCANPNPALMKNKVYFFAARNLYGKGIQKLDEDEFVEYMKIPKSEVFEKIGSEEYPHALMLAALYKYSRLQDQD